MTTVYFVRHAEPNYQNHDDFSRELSEKGLQARALVNDFFADKNIDVIVSSPYKRAYDTIFELAEERRMIIEVIDDFRERKIDSGWIEDFSGFTKRQWEDFSYKLPDGENLHEVQERNVRALKSLISKYKSKAIVVGSHGTALSTIINYYNPDFRYTQFERIKGLMPWIVRFQFEGANCINIKEYNLLKTE